MQSFRRGILNSAPPRKGKRDNARSWTYLLGVVRSIHGLLRADVGQSMCCGNDPPSNWNIDDRPSVAIQGHPATQILVGGKGMREYVLSLSEGQLVINFPGKVSVEDVEDILELMKILERMLKRMPIPATKLPEPTEQNPAPEKTKSA